MRISPLSRSPYYAYDHITGYSPGGASANAGGSPACSVWLLVGSPCGIALRRPADAERDCRAGTLGFEHAEDGPMGPPVRATVLTPALRRSLLALLQASPRAYGWDHTRWSCATLAVTLGTKRRMAVSAETVRRWLHKAGWVWQRANIV